MVLKQTQTPTHRKGKVKRTMQSWSGFLKLFCGCEQLESHHCIIFYGAASSAQWTSSEYWGSSGLLPMFTTRTILFYWAANWDVKRSAFMKKELLIKYEGSHVAG